MDCVLCSCIFLICLSALSHSPRCYLYYFLEWIDYFLLGWALGSDAGCPWVTQSRLGATAVQVQYFKTDFLKVSFFLQFADNYWFPLNLRYWKEEWMFILFCLILWLKDYGYIDYVYIWNLLPNCHCIYGYSKRKVQILMNWICFELKASFGLFSSL